MAAPGGSDFTGMVGDLVAGHADRPLVAIRAFAETPHGATPLPGIFSQ